MHVADEWSLFVKKKKKRKQVDMKLFYAAVSVQYLHEVDKSMNNDG